MNSGRAKKLRKVSGRGTGTASRDLKRNWDRMPRPEKERRARELTAPVVSRDEAVRLKMMR